MRQQDLDTLSRIFDHFAEGDFAAAVRHYDPEVEWIETRRHPGSWRLPWPDRAEGGLHRMAERSGTTTAARPRSWSDAGECAVAECGARAGAGCSGAETSEVFFQVWSFRDGSVVRIDDPPRRAKRRCWRHGAPAGQGER